MNMAYNESRQNAAMGYNTQVEEFLDSEYPMLQGKTYLDHGGTTLYAKSLIDAFSTDMITNLYGNPHSASTPSKFSGQVVDMVREKTLRFFGADPEHFDLIFVANATAAIKLVMESFKDLGELSRKADGSDGGFWYGYHIDSHNSVIGVRECSDGNHRCFTTDQEVEQWLNGSPAANQTRKLGLFAYPGQSNFSGRRLPLTWTGALRESKHDYHQDVYSLLDAAALATAYPLNGVFADPDTAPDFTSLSFYKIFGFPDLGGLIVRKASGKILQWRKYFGGGTITLVTVLGNKLTHESRTSLHDSLEDGTLAFHSIFALKAAIDTHERLYGANPMVKISKHTSYLGKRLYSAMSSLYHYNGIPVCEIYKGAESTYGDSKTQGATLAFNIVRSDGTYVPYTSIVEKLANERNIYVRSGQLCNPGGIAKYLGFNSFYPHRLWSYGHRCGTADENGTEVVNDRPTGVVRVSLGAMSTIANVDTLYSFLEKEFLVSAPTVMSRKTQRQTNDHEIKRRDDNSYMDYIDTRSNGPEKPLHRLSIGLLAHDPSIAAKGGNESSLDSTSPRGIESSWTGIVDNNELNVLAYRQPGTLMLHMQTDLPLNMRQGAGNSALRDIRHTNEQVKIIQEESERRGLKRLWNNRTRPDGQVTLV